MDRATLEAWARGEAAPPEAAAAASEAAAAEEEEAKEDATGPDLAMEGEVSFEAEEAEGGGLMGMAFQVSDVRKPLAAVWRICQKGNRVCFGPDSGDNYIQHKATGKKVMLKKKGGSYVMGVTVVRRRKDLGGPFPRRP